MMRRSLLLLVAFLLAHVLGQIAGPVDVREVCSETKFGRLCWQVEKAED